MSDRILGCLCVAIAACMAWSAQGYAAAFSYESVGPRAFPLLLSALLAAGGLWLVLKPAPGHPYAGLPLKPLLFCAGTILFYAFAFEAIGFPLATTIMAVPVGMAFGGKPLHCLVAGAILGVGSYFMFDRLLDVVLPAGWLAPLLQGS